MGTLWKLFRQKANCKTNIQNSSLGVPRSMKFNKPLVEIAHRQPFERSAVIGGFVYRFQRRKIDHTALNTNATLARPTWPSNWKMLSAAKTSKKELPSRKAVFVACFPNHWVFGVPYLYSKPIEKKKSQARAAPSHLSSGKIFKRNFPVRERIHLKSSDFTGWTIKILPTCQ